MRKSISILLSLLLIISGLAFPLSPVYATDTIVTKVAAGGNSTIVLNNDGTVWAWGEIENISIPVQNSDLNGVVDVTMGYDHALALKNNGTVWSWDKNGTITDSVYSLDNVKDISAGYNYSLALKNDGSVWTWPKYSSVTRQVYGITDAVYADMGYDYSLVVENNGSMWTWDHYSTIAEKVYGLDDVVDVSVGYDYSLALKNKGTVWMWDKNKTVAERVYGLNDVTEVSTGDSHYLALKNNGTVWAWGENSSGQIGDGTTLYRHTPVQVPGLYNVVNISAGSHHSVALQQNGTVWTWGNNMYGQLGQGTKINSTVPVQVKKANLELFSSAGDNVVNLTWNSVPGITSYKIKKSAQTGGPYRVIARNITDTGFVDEDVNNGTVYYYVVTAMNGNEEIITSNEVTACPEKPVSLNLTATAGDERVDLFWNIVPETTGFKVQRATAAEGPYITIASDIGQTSYTDNTVTNNTKYYYRVIAFRYGKTIITSKEVSVIPHRTVKNRAILLIKMTNDQEKEYDLALQAVNDFVNWYKGRSSGIGDDCYCINKEQYPGPFDSRKDFVSYNNIYGFEVMEYETH